MVVIFIHSVILPLEPRPLKPLPDSIPVVSKKDDDNNKIEKEKPKKENSIKVKNLLNHQIYFCFYSQFRLQRNRFDLLLSKVQASTPI